MKSLKFFQTQPYPCGYRKDQIASTAFLNPGQTIDKALYSRLSELGFRRSGRHIYKPACARCQACVPARIPVALFTPRRRQKRTWKRNQDLTVRIVATIDTDEHYALYADYINQRHADGDMFPPSRKQFNNFLTDEWETTRFFEFRHQGKLLATSVADVMDNGISAVYTYFDSDQASRGLGTYVVLYLIEETRRLGLPALYLGYWIEASAKMRYKGTFRPLEVQQGQDWFLLP